MAEGEGGKRAVRLGELLRPHAAALGLGLLAVLGESGANLLEPWPIKIVLDTISRTKPTHGFLMRWVYRLAGTGTRQVLEAACVMVLAVAVLDAGCTYAEKYLTTSIGQWITHELRRRMYGHLQKLSLAYHDHRHTGDLISRVTDDIDAVQTFITSACLGGVADLLTLLGMVGVMLYLNWRFTLIALAIAPPLFLVVYVYTRKSKQATRMVRRKQGEIVSRLEEVLSSIRLIKAFARERYEQRRLEEGSLEAVEAALRARSLKARLAPLVQVIVAVGTLLVLWFGANLVLAGRLSPGSLILFVWYLGKMYKPMQDLSQLTDTYSKAAVGWERINEVFAVESEVRDAPRAQRLRQTRGAIRLDHVEFGYGGGPPVLHDVNLDIRPGQRVALVGPSGAGKTTIISLIARFYDPVQGAVRLDGVDIRAYTQTSLRQQMSFVLQETLLLSGPIWQNIAYGRPEAPRQEILRAAEMANATEFIAALPEGFDTVLGERGVTLSGGQRQRLAIARAVLRNSPILIMDEPSTGLDSASEALVLEALERLMEGKTAIVIAHRLSTIRGADCIVALQEGRIVEQGKHEELLERGGLYAELCRLQDIVAEPPLRETA